MVHPGGEVREQMFRTFEVSTKLQAQVVLAPNSLSNPVSYTQPQPPLPDVLVWMFSGQRRVAYARVPAQDVLFSVVEEERGRDCGKIQSLLLTVRWGWGEWGEVHRQDRASELAACGSQKLPDCLQLSRKAKASCGFVQVSLGVKSRANLSALGLQWSGHVGKVIWKESDLP